jgi:hypothetical protein
MRKTAYAAAAIALAATIAVMWPRIAPVGPQAQTVTLAGTTGQAVRPAAGSLISPFELIMGSKELPVENWGGDAF